MVRSRHDGRQVKRLAGGLLGLLGVVLAVELSVKSCRGTPPRTTSEGSAPTPQDAPRAPAPEWIDPTAATAPSPTRATAAAPLLVVRALEAETGALLPRAWYAIVTPGPGQDERVRSWSAFEGEATLPWPDPSEVVAAPVAIVVGAEDHESIVARTIPSMEEDEELTIEARLRALGSLRIDVTCEGRPVPGSEAMVVPRESSSAQLFRMFEMSKIGGEVTTFPGFGADLAVLPDAAPTASEIVDRIAQAPAAGFELAALLATATRARRARGNDDGTLLFPALAPMAGGFIAVRAPGFTHGVVRGIQVTAGTPTRVTVTLLRGWRLWGDVTLDGAAVAGSLVHVWHVGEGLLGLTLTDHAGRFEFALRHDVDELEFKAQCSVAPAWAVARSFRRRHVAGMDDERVDIEMSSRGPVVRGRVVRRTDGAPVPFAEVDLGAKGPSVTCDEQGGWRASGLEPAAFPLTGNVVYEGGMKSFEFTLLREEADDFVELKVD